MTVCFFHFGEQKQTDFKGKKGLKIYRNHEIKNSQNNKFKHNLNILFYHTTRLKRCDFFNDIYISMK